MELVRKRIKGTGNYDDALLVNECQTQEANKKGFGLSMFKLSFKRNKQSDKANQFPLSLAATEVLQLKELLRSPGWGAYRSLLERYANLRAQRLLTPLPPDQTNVERGAIAALFEVAALPDQLIKHIGDQNDRLKRDGANDNAADFTWAWGHELFRDRFRHP